MKQCLVLKKINKVLHEFLVINVMTYATEHLHAACLIFR